MLDLALSLQAKDGKRRLDLRQLLINRVKAQTQGLGQGHLSIPVLLEELDSCLDFARAELHPLASNLDQGYLKACQLSELGLAEGIVAQRKLPVVLDQ